MQSTKVLERFQIAVDKEPKSIYPFSPVYHVPYKGKDVIVKKTQKPLERAEALAKYTRFLRANGVPIVTPIKMDTNNPQELEDACYVVYPFIHGKSYTATHTQIYASGCLLGHIHALSPKGELFQLPEYAVYDFTNEEVEESVRAITTHVKRNRVTFPITQLEEKLLSCVTKQSCLKELLLPHVLTPHDYKANNLVFTPEPYLIDPDNAAKVPRVFDLALALLLFHNELSSAPDYVFTVEQWKTFLSGYYQFVQVTEVEKRVWEMALEHVFLDEVMWLMAEVPEDWEKPSQRQLFLSVVHLLLHSQPYEI
ncbi:phosphotransferase [Virgibacillus sp. Bac330]|uniref:phosphotransferase n=1 Tax=Virgibacillus sp. Bac330 TaxID=2419841 RepID=UPI000EF4C0BA|nr:phosphotransferase [Virgibacillus sp. Bac330]